MIDGGTLQIKEGFLCPLCYKDLGNILQLQAHFEDSHEDADKDLIQAFKGIFGRAKKVLKIDDGSNSGMTQNSVVREKRKSIFRGENIYEKLDFEYMTMPIGVVRNLNESYKSARASRFDIYIEQSNQLLVKLDLLINPPAQTTLSDLKSRKDYDKSIVPWVPDNLVRQCPYCYRPFNLPTRRKHHCRLCGAVLCHSCSVFISAHKAQILTNPLLTVSPAGSLLNITTNMLESNASSFSISSSDNFNSSKNSFSTYSPTQNSHLNPISEEIASPNEIDSNIIEKSNSPVSYPSPPSSLYSQNLSGGSILKRADSLSSLNSYFNSTTGNAHLRLCPDCDRLIQKRFAHTAALKTQASALNTSPKSNRSLTLDNLTSNNSDLTGLFTAKTIQFLTVYKELWDCIKNVRILMPSYCAKVESLSTYGKSLNQYDQASEIKCKILKIGERIEGLSRLILTIATTTPSTASTKPPSSPLETARDSNRINDVDGVCKLARAIRFMACNFLKDNYLTLPKLPDRTEYATTLAHFDTTKFSTDNRTMSTNNNNNNHIISEATKSIDSNSAPLGSNSKLTVNRSDPNLLPAGTKVKRSSSSHSIHQSQLTGIVDSLPVKPGINFKTDTSKLPYTQTVVTNGPPHQNKPFTERTKKSSNTKSLASQASSNNYHQNHFDEAHRRNKSLTLAPDSRFKETNNASSKITLNNNNKNNNSKNKNNNYEVRAISPTNPFSPNDDEDDSFVGKNTNIIHSNSNTVSNISDSDPNIKNKFLNRSPSTNPFECESDQTLTERHSPPKIIHKNKISDSRIQTETHISALRDQIKVVKGYLAQALNTDNLDEVYTLESNLKELHLQLNSFEGQS